MNVRRWERHPFHAWQFRHDLLGAHIDPGYAPRLAGWITCNPPFFFQGRKIIGRNDVGYVDALTINIEFPSVINATNSTLFISAEEQWRELMRTIGCDYSNLPVGIAESKQVFAQNAYANGCAVRIGQLAGKKRGKPKAPEQVSHRRTGTHPRNGVEAIALHGHALSPPADRGWLCFKFRFEQFAKAKRSILPAIGTFTAIAAKGTGRVSGCSFPSDLRKSL